MRTVRHALVCLTALGCWAGCAGSEPAANVLVDGLTVGPITLEPGAEDDNTCVSVELNNDEPIYVSSIRAETHGAFHHSNWYWANRTHYAGPDGVWKCSDRSFDTFAAAYNGGVLFATSTQSESDEQRFGEGGAIEIPPHSRIIGNLHLLNAQPRAVATGVTLHFETLDASEVQHEMQALGIVYQALDLAPRGRSHFVTECDIGGIYERQLGRETDFNVYYALPHYHSLGILARAELVGGERDGEVLFETSSATGEPWGRSYTTPEPVRGAERIRFTCGFDNPRDQRVAWGITDQEMCALGLYTDSPFKIAGAVTENVVDGPNGEGVVMNHGECQIAAFRP